MKTVILCGGMGTRLREETEIKPKPMVLIGEQPILWHIMKLYSHFGFNHFILALGYKGKVIRDYFLNYRLMNTDVTLTIGRPDAPRLHASSSEDHWTVTLADTGLATGTGGRVKRLAKYLDGSTFMCTYGDGVGDVDLQALLRFHRAHGKAATVTGVRPPSRFGVMDLAADGRVVGFREKPQHGDRVNAGFFVFEPRVLDYLDADGMIAPGPLEALARDNQLMCYEHDGFWQCMDTYSDRVLLENLWRSTRCPWKLWP